MLKKYIYSFITIGLASVLLLSCARRAETDEPEKPVNLALISENISKADQLFTERADITKLREAIKLLTFVRNPGARNYEVEWKFAKYNYFLGDETKDEKESETAFENGKQAGQIASRMSPDKPDGYFWYAANLGEQAKKSPITVGLKSVDEIRASMNKVIEIEPSYQNASAYDALAQLELNTRLTGGKPEKAVEYLEKGLAIEKNNSFLRIDLAEAYLAVGRKTDAKTQLEYILQMKPQPEYAIEHQEVLEDAKKMLKSNF